MSTKSKPAMPVRALDVEYRDIPGFPGYQAGSDGSVWSRKTKGGNDRTAGKLRDSFRPLSQCTNSNGYSVVNLFQDGKNLIVPVCYLVLFAFVGPRPPGMQACHFPDGDRTNSHASNLRWDTQSGNQQDRKLHGTVTSLKGSVNPFSKLTEENVVQIREMRKQGVSLREIGERFGITKQTASGICLRKAWKHVVTE